MLTLQIALGIVIGVLVVDYIRKNGIDNILNSLFTRKGIKNILFLIVPYMCVCKYVYEETSYNVDEDNLYLIPQYLVAYILLYKINEKIPYKRIYNFIKSSILGAFTKGIKFLANIKTYATHLLTLKINRKRYLCALIAYLVLSGLSMLAFIGVGNANAYYPPIWGFHPLIYAVIMPILQILFVIAIIQRSNSFTDMGWFFAWCFVLAQISFQNELFFKDGETINRVLLLQIPRVCDYIVGLFLLFYPNKETTNPLSPKQMYHNYVWVVIAFFIYYAICSYFIVHPNTSPSLSDPEEDIVWEPVNIPDNDNTIPDNIANDEGWEYEDLNISHNDNNQEINPDDFEWEPVNGQVTNQ